MANRRLEGWLFDVDELGPQVALWVYTADNRLIRLAEEFQPPVYVQGERAKLKSLAWELERRGIISHVRWTERREFWSGDFITVLELHVADASLMPRLRALAAARDRELAFYNADIPTAQYYLYLKGLFPLCRLACEVDEANNVIEIAATDSVWETDYRLPELRVLTMRGERMRPVRDDSCMTLECGGEQTRLLVKDGRHLVEAFNAFIKRHDPDVVLSERGDALLIPALLKIARRAQIDLALDRDRIITKRKIITEGRTYFSYGRVIYKGPSYPLFGRWHIDSKNSFIHRETEMDGLIELSRLAKIPIQRMARTSPGSAMSSMQMDRAIKEGILIPLTKSEPEAYKTALELLVIDKGGLTFQPQVGAFEQVAELDFASMYPSIMTRYNISPETVLCSCCSNSFVPEAGYNLCRRRRGLTPLTLEPLLERRKRYKKAMRESEDEKQRERNDSRQTAIKWMLVSCFGYLGYKNARFGRIEAHEATTAYGREMLLRAKEITEAAGFKVLHALTDSLWIKLTETTEAELLALCERITQATKIEMSLEGIYKWIVFLPSKVDNTRPVAVRYYGVFTDGKLKLRGLACRRSDMPEFVKAAQWEMIRAVAKAATLEERFELIQQAELILRERIDVLEQGVVDPQELLMKRTLTRDVEEYKVETRTALAARQLKRAGVRTHAGERVRYLITDARAKDKANRVRAEEIDRGKGYDAEEYIKILKAAAAEIIYPQPVLTRPDAAERSSEFFSCFISYSSTDHKFAERLYADLQQQEIRCWFAPEDLRIGASLRAGIDESIRRYDKLLLVLSNNSISSDWVEKEVETAMEQERSQKRIVLFPIRLDDTVMEINSGWPADIRRTGNIGDFRRWENPAVYKKAFDRLLRDLKAEKRQS
jgi:DNA polymerase-2